MLALPHIALVDDEKDITQLLAGYFSRQGFRTTQLHDGRSLLNLVAADPPDIVLLDLGLHGEDGLAIARQLRSQWRGGLLIVSGRMEGVDKVVGLEIGADDYVTKPFDLRELLARVRAVLRRVSPEAGPAGPAPANGNVRYAFAGMVLDLTARSLRRASGEEIALSGGEFELLSALVRHPGRVLSRDFLLEHTRGRDAAPFDRAIDVQIARLRKKLEDDPENPQIVKSVRGAGYIMVAPVSKE